MNANDEAIAAVLANYQDALNQSDTDAVMKLYASDGVFTPQHSPSSVGAVRKAYDAVFDAITLDVDFEVADIRQIAPDWVRPGRSRSTRPAMAVRRPTRSSSYSRRSTAPGRLRATASPPPNHRAHKGEGIVLAMTKCVDPRLAR
jgi:uncharacterized protein (TIGR02246 family)